MRAHVGGQRATGAEKPVANFALPFLLFMRARLRTIQVVVRVRARRIAAKLAFFPRVRAHVVAHADDHDHFPAHRAHGLRRRRRVVDLPVIRQSPLGFVRPQAVHALERHFVRVNGYLVRLQRRPAAEHLVANVALERRLPVLADVVQAQRSARLAHGSAHGAFESLGAELQDVLVHFQLPQLAKRFLAHRTLVRFHTLVDLANVSVATAGADEALAADVTLERLSASVLVHVHFQVLRLAEGFAAYFARVRLDPSVNNFLVFFAAVPGSKGFLAQAALVRLRRIRLSVQVQPIGDFFNLGDLRVLETRGNMLLETFFAACLVIALPTTKVLLRICAVCMRLI